MINLLPTDYKNDIGYARRNTVLRRWIILSIIALLGVAIIIAGGMLYMQQSIKSYTKQLDVTQQALNSQKVEETQKQVADISGNTKLAIQVLSREVLFSKLLTKIGSALPSNTTLKSLTIDNTQGAIQLSAQAHDFNSATQLQVNLQDSKNGVFEKADINSITCSSVNDPTDPNSAPVDPNDPIAKIKLQYPCDVSIRALFGKINSYNYIPTTTGTGATKK